MFSGSCFGSAFSTAVLVIHCVWISQFHHLISGWVTILYIMLVYSLKNLCNLYVQWQKYCFIVCMRVLVVCCMNFTFDQLMILYFSFLAMCILWKFWYILWCIFSKNSVWFVVHFAMVYLMMYILWRVCMTRCTITKCLVIICIYVLFCYL